MNTVIADRGGVTWTEAGFEAVLAGARSDLRAVASRALRDAGGVAVAAADVTVALDRLTAPTLAPSVTDASAQLLRLVRPGFITAAGTARLTDVQRYVRGISARLGKVAEDPVRDQRRIAEVTVVETHYQRLLAALAPSQVTPRVVEVGWMLEELRVSVFAQSVGAKGRVSTTRVRAEIDQLFAGHLD